MYTCMTVCTRCVHTCSVRMFVCTMYVCIHGVYGCLCTGGLHKANKRKPKRSGIWLGIEPRTFWYTDQALLPSESLDSLMTDDCIIVLILTRASKFKPNCFQLHVTDKQCPNHEAVLCTCTCRVYGSTCTCTITCICTSIMCCKFVCT